MERQEIYGVQPETGAIIDFTSLLGNWINFNQETKGIKKFTLTQREEKIFIHVYGVEEPEDWGETEAIIFMDNIGEKAFYAQYNIGTVESLLTADLNKGLWAILAFHHFQDGSQTNFFRREFYHRAEH